MIRRQAFKFKLCPNGQQERAMRRFAGSCRVVFNEFLSLQKTIFQSKGKKLSYADCCKTLTTWRHGAMLPSGRVAPWLAEAPTHSLQQSIKNLERAYINFFEKRADFPRFKKKGSADSFRFPDPKQFKIDQKNNRLFLPKLGWMRYRNSRDILGKAKNITISHKCGKWFASIQTERDVEPKIPQGDAIGIDMGIVRFATLSDGRYFEPINSFKLYEKSLRKAQQKLSRKVKFSKNWNKAKVRVQNIHSCISNVRRDFLHKASTTITKNHRIVCIEDLQVGNMSRSAAGTTDAPGKNVSAKSGLNKAILDQGWSEFRRQLDYKLAWNNAWLIAVPPHNTSRICPCCGHTSGENRKTQSKFCCVECGFEENSDLVGAINILSRGIKMLRDEGQDRGDASLRCFRTARIACEVSDVLKSPAAGTHRSDFDRIFNSV